jgi:hypothetical protein
MTHKHARAHQFCHKPSERDPVNDSVYFNRQTHLCNTLYEMGYGWTYTRDFQLLKRSKNVSKLDRQHTYNVTLWRVRAPTVQWKYNNAFCVRVIELHVTVIYIKVFSVAQKCFCGNFTWPAKMQIIRTSVWRTPYSNLPALFSHATHKCCIETKWCSFFCVFHTVYYMKPYEKKNKCICELYTLFINHTNMFPSPSATMVSVYSIKEYNKKLCVANLFKIWIYKML